MVSPDGPRLSLRRRLAARVRRANRLEGEDRIDLRDRDRKHHNRPERLKRSLLEREVRRGIDVAAEERVEILPDHEPKRSEHADTTVLQLNLAVELQLALRKLLVAAESQRVPESQRLGHSRHLLRVSNAIELRRRVFRSLPHHREQRELVLRHQLLHNHTRRRNHRQPTVVQFLRLHLLQLSRILRLQPKRIEAEVARLMVSPDGPRLSLRRRLAARVRRANRLEGEDRIDLRDRDRKHHNRPERLKRSLLEREVRRGIDVAAEERVEILPDHEPKRSEHADTTVLQLNLAVELQLALRKLLVAAESQRVPESQRLGHSRELLRVSDAVELRFRLRSLAHH